MMLLSKRGDVGDIAVVIVVFTVFCIVTLIGFTLEQEFKVKYNESLENTTGPAARQAAMSQFVLLEQAFAVLNTSAILVVGGLGIGIVIFAFFIKSHPIFFPLSLFVGAVLVMISAIMADIYGMMAETPRLSSAAASFTTMSTVMQYLPHFVAVFAILTMIVMYTKSKEEA